MMRGTSLFRRLPLASVMFTLSLGIPGCGAEPVDPGVLPETSRIRITANVAGAAISTLVVEVTAADIPSPLVFNLSVDAGTGIASGAVRVPHGDARVFALTAYDATGEITHEGETTIAVRPGPNPPIQISLGPRSGHVPLTVTFGSYSVIVMPGNAALDLEVDATIQLSVQVLDQDGQAVADLSALQWATNAPAVATVDAGGLVTGIIAGSATIVATYEGVAGQSLITVTGDGSDPDGGGPTDCDDGDPSTVDTCDADEDGWDVFLDCDDTDPDTHPGATEVIGDGKDNDCDGIVE